jgi:integrase
MAIRFPGTFSVEFSNSRKSKDMCHAVSKSPPNADVPEAPEGQETYAYSLEEVRTMLALLPERARTAVAVAAMTGMRASEIRGLEWSAYDANAGTIIVSKSRWRKFTRPPKTKKSRAPIPVIPYLAKILEAHRLREGNPVAGPIFRNGRGNPLCIDSLGQRVIREVKGIEWHGWHAFRRGLATNLNRIGVDDSVIQAILRHSTVAVTQEHYIKTVRSDAVNAMQQFENALENSLSCATVRQEQEPAVVN